MRHVSLDTAVQRAHARYPNAHLLPSSPDGIADWLRRHGIDPDTEAGMECLAWLEESNIWTATEPNQPDTPERLVSPVATVSPDTGRVCSNRPALVAPVAARRFIDWIHAEGREGAYLAAEIESLYLEHATAIGHDPTPQSPLRMALKAMGIVSATVQTGHRSGNRKERRIRNVQWQLFKTVSAAPKLVPDQAMARLAARLAA